MEVDQGIFYCPFGSTLSLSPDVTVMFAGGAESTDKGWRLSEMAKGSPKIWWSQEGIQESDPDSLPLRGVECGGSPSLWVSKGGLPPTSWVVSHTCPIGVPIEDALVGKQHWDRLPKFNEPSLEMLDVVRQKYRPRQWFFGHYHIRAEGVTDGCEWTCLDIFNRGKGGFRKIWQEWED